LKVARLILSETDLLLGCSLASHIIEQIGVLEHRAICSSVLCFTLMASDTLRSKSIISKQHCLFVF
jgi:hypothetical protein